MMFETMLTVHSFCVVKTVGKTRLCIKINYDMSGLEHHVT